MSERQETVRIWATRLSSPSLAGRAEATHDLAQLGDEGVEIALRILEEAERLELGSPQMARRGALIALGRSGGRASATVRVLTTWLFDDTLGADAARALGDMGPQAPEAVGALVKVLPYRRPHLDLTYEAAMALAKIGDEAALAALEERVEDASGCEVTRGACRLALGSGRKAKG